MKELTLKRVRFIIDRHNELKKKLQEFTEEETVIEEKEEKLVDLVTETQELTATIKVTDEFRSGFRLPLKITGFALHAGEHKAGVFYPIAELEKSANELTGTLIYLDHDKSTVLSRVGKVSKSWFDPKEVAIAFEGWVEDANIASKIYYGLIDSVSVGVESMRIPTEEHILAKNLEFTELSLVQSGADYNAKIWIKGK